MERSLLAATNAFTASTNYGLRFSSPAGSFSTFTLLNAFTWTPTAAAGIPYLSSGVAGTPTLAGMATAALLAMAAAFQL
eukprot:tig00020562_g11177.t1